MTSHCLLCLSNYPHLSPSHFLHSTFWSKVLHYAIIVFFLQWVFLFFPVSCTWVSSLKLWLYLENCPNLTGTYQQDFCFALKIVKQVIQVKFFHTVPYILLKIIDFRCSVKYSELINICISKDLACLILRLCLFNVNFMLFHSVTFQRKFLRKEVLALINY